MAEMEAVEKEKFHERGDCGVTILPIWEGPKSRFNGRSELLQSPWRPYRAAARDR